MEFAEGGIITADEANDILRQIMLERGDYIIPRSKFRRIENIDLLSLLDTGDDDVVE